MPKSGILKDLFKRCRKSKEVKPNKWCLRFECLESRCLLAVAAGGLGQSAVDSHFAAPLAASVHGAFSPSDIDIGNLNSKPDSPYSIYLDFDGHVTSGTNWNKVYTNGADIVSPRFTLDGDFSKESFTLAEQFAIYEIWLRVSEDYMPFDVNVTTVEPVAEDFLVGRAQRVVIGGSYNDWYGTPAAGISWVGSFTSRKDIPNFVFSESVEANIKYVAESAAHEVGHSLGLNHRGNSQIADQDEYFEGMNGWAPIMGASYYQELTQWCKGEYAGAQNMVDELNVITTQNGFGYRDDDYSDSFEDAAHLAINEGTGKISGIIERNTDRDCFVFESNGSPLDFQIGGISGITNLDVLVTIYREDYQTLSVYNPSDRLDVEFSFTEQAGLYYLTVEGTGLQTDWPGIYSDYGSLGAYTIRVGSPDCLLVTTLDDTFSKDDGLSLREAVFIADDRTTIHFDPSLAGGTILLTEGEILLTHSITIDASSVNGITIDAGGLSRIFSITGTVELNGLTLMGGRQVERGAAIYNTGRITLINCSLTGNIAEEHGALLVGGGALFNAQGASASLICCDLRENTGNFGGAIYNKGNLIITQTNLLNSASWQSNGGSIYNDGTLRCVESLFSENSSPTKPGTLAGGGAVYISKDADAEFISCSFISNTATFGGAIMNFGVCTFEDVFLKMNTAAYFRGGAVYNNAELIVKNSIFAGNVAPAAENLMAGGGAVYNARSASAFITQSLLYDNTGNFGGALINAGAMEITASTITRNRADGRDGGGILNAGTLDISNSIVAGNKTSEEHPDIYNYAGLTGGSFNISSFTVWDTGDSNIPYGGTPLFANPDQNDFTLDPVSIAVDAGSNVFIATQTDLAGNSRIYNGIVDVGAYEYTEFGPQQLPAPAILTGGKGFYVSCGVNRQQIVWEPVENAAGYELCYSHNSTDWTSVMVTGTSVVITGLSYGACITYRVRAISSELFTDSDWSAPKTFNVCPMDINGDGDISGGDRALLAAAWLAEEGDDGYMHCCDINGDGDISSGDRAFLSNNWLCEAQDDDLVYPISSRADAVFAEYDSHFPKSDPFLP